MGKQLNELWKYAQQTVGEEDRFPDPQDFTEPNKEKVEAAVEQLNKALSGKSEVDNKVKAKMQHYWPSGFHRPLGNMCNKREYSLRATGLAKLIRTLFSCS